VLDAHPHRNDEINSAFRTVAQQYLLDRWSRTKRCGIESRLTPRKQSRDWSALDVKEHGTWRAALESQGFRWLGPTTVSISTSRDLERKPTTVSMFWRSSVCGIETILTTRSQRMAATTVDRGSFEEGSSAWFREGPAKTVRTIPTPVRRSSGRSSTRDALSLSPRRDTPQRGRRAPRARRSRRQTATPMQSLRARNHDAVRRFRGSSRAPLAIILERALALARVYLAERGLDAD